MRASSVRSQSSSSITKYAGGRRRIMIWLVSMLLFAGWAACTFFSQSSQLEDKKAKLAKQEQDKAEMQQAVKQLQYEVGRLQDSEYIGQLVRSKYGMYKPGEVPILGGNK
ncbi:septum formation initiator family protein [Paenibacillus sp. JX-17]|uniref:Septum formation initiator family protein n=1 Tax=Paenibacillus lacisoli TaxID=3064525 RepID=A0ABT9CH22_9BACL|nr:septum formation initiator family protein [Paenibacillus sp. JX-17]MDO7908583.1 septum formation initiator family protein [Paenibacillus sp. JX-17]